MAAINDRPRRLNRDYARLYPFKVSWVKWLEITLVIDEFHWYWLARLCDKQFQLYKLHIDWHDGNWVTDSLDDDWEIPF